MLLTAAFFLLSTICFLQATSSLDTETEQAVQESLRLLGENRTLIVIAHRLSTVQDADCIYVLEQGCVAESGTHAELLRKPGGRYAELVMKMKQGSDDLVDAVAAAAAEEGGRR